MTICSKLHSQALRENEFLDPKNTKVDSKNRIFLREKRIF